MLFVVFIDLEGQILCLHTLKEKGSKSCSSPKKIIW